MDSTTIALFQLVKKIKQRIKSQKRSNVGTLAVVLFLALVIPVTLLGLQSQKTIQEHAASANPYTGLHVSGNQIVNGAGQTVHVHGVNVTEMFYGNQGICNTISNQIIDGIATWNVNWVRLWISPKDWIANTSCGGGVGYQTAVMNIIHRIEGDGMIAEIANPTDYPVDGNGHTAGLSTTGKQFWTSFTPFVVSEPAIALDLINEPIGTTDDANGWKCLFQGLASGTCNQGAGANWNGQGQYQYVGYNDVIAIIRGDGFTGPIGVAGTNYARGSNGFQTWAPKGQGIYMAYHEYGAFSDPTSLLNNLKVNWSAFPVLLQEFQGDDTWNNQVMTGIDSGSGVGYVIWQWGNDGSNDGLQIVQPDTCPTCYVYTGKSYHDYIAGQSGLTGSGVTPTLTPTGPTSTPGPTLPPPITWTTNATVSPTTPQTNGTATITANVKASGATQALVDVEVYSLGTGTPQVLQLFFDNQSFSANQAKSFPVTWNIPSTTTVGDYVVKIGIFSPGWGSLLDWNDGALTFSVAQGGSATPTPTLQPTNTPPTVTITKPTNGSTVNGVLQMPTTATASDTNGTITKVDFYLDNDTTPDATAMTSPYNVTLNMFGYHHDDCAVHTVKLTAKATDNLGATAQNVITFTWIDTCPPTSTPTTNPTNTPVPNSTTLSFPSIFLHGLGKAGDSVNPGSNGNLTPIHSSRTVTVQLYDGSNQLITTKTGTITYQSATGDFKGTVDLGTPFTSGTYLVKVSTPSYLLTQVAGFYQFTSGQTVTLPQVTMVVGDANGDNKLDILDYNMLLGCYSDLAPATNCPGNNKALTDFSDDGNVNQTDYNLFLRELSVRTGQ